MTEATKPDARPHFRAVLTPHRSLSPRGFLSLMMFVGAVNAVLGIAFLMLGAWPVFVFCGLDVLLIYLAFKLSYRSGRECETIEIGPATVVLTRVQPDGASESFALNAYWARVQLGEHVSGTTELRLASHGRSIPFARFLSDDERRELASVLAAELAAARSGPI